MAAWHLQLKLVEAKKSTCIETDIFMMVEHPPVFTLGKRGGRENLIISEAALEKTGIPVIHVERGGNITFHGPGQLVLYPILNIRAAGLSVVEYVYLLEEIMIRTVAAWGIMAERKSLNRGIWVGANKIGSVGIAVRKGISFHGFALNVNLALDPFFWIHPCGLQGIGMTSMAKELKKTIPMDQVRRSVMDHVETLFEVKLSGTSVADLLDKIACPANEPAYG